MRLHEARERCGSHRPPTRPLPCSRTAVSARLVGPPAEEESASRQARPTRRAASSGRPRSCCCGRATAENKEPSYGRLRELETTAGTRPALTARAAGALEKTEKTARYFMALSKMKALLLLGLAASAATLKVCTNVTHARSCSVRARAPGPHLPVQSGPTEPWPVPRCALHALHLLQVACS